MKRLGTRLAATFPDGRGRSIPAARHATPAKARVRRYQPLRRCNHNDTKVSAKLGASVSREDWYRHKDWSPTIEADFFAKFASARNKAQYLRIQASTIAQSHPEVALGLLQRYFELGEHFDIAQAHYDRATAQLALRNIPGAIESYEAALEREEIYPHLKTNAYISLPVLIARERLKDRYSQALDLLEKYRDRVLFPVDVFCWNGVLAIVLAETGKRDKAADAADAALKAAGLTHSGFDRHPKIGLIGPKDSDLLERVRKIAKR